MTIHRIVCLFSIFATLLTQVWVQELIFRRNNKTGAFIRATGSYSDAMAEVITPHRWNTQRHTDYIPTTQLLQVIKKIRQCRIFYF